MTSKPNFPIEKGVPVPPPATKYGFDLMEIGDSIFVPGAPIRLVSSSYCTFGKRHGKKFAGRTVDGGCRVWRIE